MYRFGSSSRGATGKQGHGGRPYRPPPERGRRGETTPPPLKQCDVVLEVNISEYMTEASSHQQGEDSGNHNRNHGRHRHRHDQQAPHRQHVALGGRSKVESLERHLRSCYLVHLLIPGKRQSGPVAIVGESIEQAIPAMAYLLSCIHHYPTSMSVQQQQQRGQHPDARPAPEHQQQQQQSLPGRIFVNISKNPTMTTNPICGQWLFGSACQVQPEHFDIQQAIPWVFQCSDNNENFQKDWNIIVLSYATAIQNRFDASVSPPSDQGDEPDAVTTTTASLSVTASFSATPASTTIATITQPPCTAESATSLAKSSTAIPPTSSSLIRFQKLWNLCRDNATFRLGQEFLKHLKFFVHDTTGSVFAIGQRHALCQLWNDIMVTLEEENI